jgi:hypothetical protein
METVVGCTPVGLGLYVAGMHTDPDRIHFEVIETVLCALVGPAFFCMLTPSPPKVDEMEVMGFDDDSGGE